MNDYTAGNKIVPLVEHIRDDLISQLAEPEKFSWAIVAYPSLHHLVIERWPGQAVVRHPLFPVLLRGLNVEHRHVREIIDNAAALAVGYLLVEFPANFIVTGITAGGSLFAVRPHQWLLQPGVDEWRQLSDLNWFKPSWQLSIRNSQGLARYPQYETHPAVDPVQYWSQVLRQSPEPWQTTYTGNDLARIRNQNKIRKN